MNSDLDNPLPTNGLSSASRSFVRWYHDSRRLPTLKTRFEMDVNTIPWLSVSCICNDDLHCYNFNRAFVLFVSILGVSKPRSAKQQDNIKWAHKPFVTVYTLFNFLQETPWPINGNKVLIKDYIHTSSRATRFVYHFWWRHKPLCGAWWDLLLPVQSDWLNTDFIYCNVYNHCFKYIHCPSININHAQLQWVIENRISNATCSCHKRLESLWCCLHVLCWTAFKLTHWSRDKMDAISQTTLWSSFPWMKMFEFRLKFHWSMFLRVQLTKFQHWFR